MTESFIGQQKKITVIADETKLAVNVKSGNLEVFATPAVVAAIEQAANELASCFIDESKTTVGTMISIEHKAPTVKGQTITVKAVVVSFDGRKFVFDVSATDLYGEIASGRHERVVVDMQKFMQKALKRAHQI